MDDIAKHLGMSKKTIYQFYADKNEIISRLINESLLKNKCEFDEVTQKSRNSIEEILDMMKLMGDMFKRMNPNFYYDLQKYHPAVWQSFRSFKEKFILEAVEKNLKKGIEEQLFRKDINIRIIAKLRIEEVEMAMNPEIFPSDVYNIAEVQMNLLDHFLHGITTLKGHRLINKYKQLIEEE